MENDNGLKHCVRSIWAKIQTSDDLIRWKKSWAWIVYRLQKIYRLMFVIWISLVKNGCSAFSLLTNFFFAYLSGFQKDSWTWHWSQNMLVWLNRRIRNVMMDMLIDAVNAIRTVRCFVQTRNSQAIIT